jgi:protein-tyrosine phosphatase
MKILMVCLGNICRSPLAEAVLQDKAKRVGLGWEIDSAGTNGYHVGASPHKLSQKVARLHGIDIGKQRARLFVAEDFIRFDRIYAMAGDIIVEMRRIAGKQFNPAKAELLMNVLYPGENRDIPDPWSGPESGYHLVYNMINEACGAVIREYTKANRI